MLGLHLHYKCQKVNWTNTGSVPLPHTATNHSLKLLVDNPEEDIECQVWLAASLLNVSTQVQLSNAYTVSVKPGKHTLHVPECTALK